MSGINVLNKTQIMETPSWVYTLFFAGLISVVIGIVFLISVKKNNFKSFIIGLVLFIIGLVLINAPTEYADIMPTGKYQYEVTIDENVSFVDLNNKYNVIEQRGDIYVLEDK